jgi:ribonuclease HI
MKNDMQDSVEIYTDGGCDPNPGCGGWAVVLIYKGNIKELSGGEIETTNNRMELMAAINALKALKRSCPLILHTDSQYVQRGITQWLPGWKKKGWTRGRGEVKNLDLWKELDELASKYDIEWRWVRGHAGNLYNERCDELAAEAIRKVKKQAGK